MRMRGVYVLPLSHGRRLRGTTTLWLSLVILRKMVGRANSNDLEIPGGEEFPGGAFGAEKCNRNEVDKYPC